MSGRARIPVVEDEPDLPRIAVCRLEKVARLVAGRAGERSGEP